MRLIPQGKKWDLLNFSQDLIIFFFAFLFWRKEKRKDLLLEAWGQMSMVSKQILNSSCRRYNTRWDITWSPLNFNQNTASSQWLMQKIWRRWHFSIIILENILTDREQPNNTKLKKHFSLCIENSSALFLQKKIPKNTSPKTTIFYTWKCNFEDY